MSYQSKSPCIPVYKDLAPIIGLRESLFLAQLHYWLHKSPHWIDGNPWVYNTYQQWSDQLPLVTVDRFKNIASKLRKVGIVTTTEHNKDKRNRTRWYSIDYNHQLLKDANLDWTAPVKNKKEAGTKRPTPTKTTPAIRQNRPLPSDKNDPRKPDKNDPCSSGQNDPIPIQYITQKNNQENIIQISEREESLDFSLKTEISKNLKEEKTEELPISDDFLQEEEKIEIQEDLVDFNTEEKIENKTEVQDDSVKIGVRSENEELDPELYYTEGPYKGYELHLTADDISRIKRLHEPIVNIVPKTISAMEFATNVVENITPERRKELYDEFSTLDVHTDSKEYTLTRTEINILRKYKFSPYMREQAAMFVMKALERKKEKEPVENDYAYRMRVFESIVSGECKKFQPEDVDTRFQRLYYMFHNSMSDREVMFYISGM